MPPRVRPRRSILYVPGSNPRAIEKAKTLTADTMILDLEDAVAPESKDEARDAVAAAVAALSGGPSEVVVRVNGHDTPWIAHDVAMVAHTRPHAVLFPKLSSPEDIGSARAALLATRAPAELPLWAMIETPSAILHAATMAAAAAAPGLPITCFVAGTNDLAAALGARVRPGRAALMPHLATLVLAARAYGIAVIDGTFTDIGDAAGFAAECDQGRDLGFDGKSLIHPSQIGIANRVFGPTAEEIAWARQVVGAFADPANAGRGVLTVDGRMVERLHERAAKRTLAMAEAINAMEREASP